MEIKGQKSNYGSLTLEEKLSWWKNTNNYFHDFSKWFIKKECYHDKETHLKNFENNFYYM